MSTLAGLLLESEGCPIDDVQLMSGLLVSAVLAACRRHGVAPVGTLSVAPLVPATLNGRALFEDDESRGYRWELTILDRGTTSV